MTTFTKTANGAFDLSAFSGRELQELFEAIENEIERRQDALATKVQPIKPSEQGEDITLESELLM